MTKICITLDDETKNDLTMICDEEGIDLEDALKRLLKEGIRIWKKDFSLNMLKAGKWTIGKAAKFLGVPFREMVKIIEETKLELGERVPS